jgi:hypothetical protein
MHVSGFLPARKTGSLADKLAAKAIFGNSILGHLFSATARGSNCWIHPPAFVVKKNNV